MARWAADSRFSIIARGRSFYDSRCRPFEECDTRYNRCRKHTRRPRGLVAQKDIVKAKLGSPSHDREENLHIRDSLRWNCRGVIGEDHKVSEFSNRNAPLHVLLK